MLQNIFPISIFHISGLKHLVLPCNEPVEHIQGSFLGHHLSLGVPKFEDVSVEVFNGPVAAVENCKHGSASRMSNLLHLSKHLCDRLNKAHSRLGTAREEVTGVLCLKILHKPSRSVQCSLYLHAEGLIRSRILDLVVIQTKATEAKCEGT